jgi:hypothetical protein
MDYGNKVETTNFSMDESILVKVETKFAGAPSCVNKEVPKSTSDRITTTLSLGSPLYLWTAFNEIFLFITDIDVHHCDTIDVKRPTTIWK